MPDHPPEHELHDLIHVAEVVSGVVLIPLVLDLLGRFTDYVKTRSAEFSALFGLIFMAVFWALVSKDATTVSHWLEKGLAAGMGGTIIHHRTKPRVGWDEPPISEESQVTQLRRKIRGKED